MSLPRALAALGVALGCNACAAAPIVIEHVAIVDVASGAVRIDQSVTLDGERIAALGPSPPGAASGIDGRGLFLIPGLWDMHLHAGEIYDEDGKQRLTALLLANGVTGARLMRGSELQRAWRREIAAGRLGPELVIGSNFIDGPEPIWPGSLAVGDAEAARRAVADEQAAGADFLKVYSLLPRDAFFALAVEARRRGLAFAGHVPILVTPGEAADAGIASIEHLTGLLTACSRLAAETRGRIYAFTLAMARAQSASSERFLDLNIAALDAYDERLAAALIDQLRRDRTWQVPTLAYLHHAIDLADARLGDDPRLAYVRSDTRARWLESSALRRARWAPESYAKAQRLFDAQLKLVGDLHRAGVPLLAGTDVGNAWLYPGFSLHDELAWLVRAGLTPLDALRAATLDAARFLGRSDDGVIAPGARANLALLGGNPLADIDAVRDVRGVVVGGRWLSRAALDAMLEQAKDKQKRVGAD
jgi:imidazolonepropionase-like amidohydrolase